jgi:hypothetical protein
MIKGTRVGIEALILGVLTNIGGKFMQKFEAVRLSLIVTHISALSRCKQASCLVSRDWYAVLNAHRIDAFDFHILMHRI